MSDVSLFCCLHLRQVFVFGAKLSIRGVINCNRNPAVQEEMCDMEDDYRAVELILPTSPCRKKRRCSPTDNDSEDVRTSELEDQKI